MHDEMSTFLAHLLHSSTVTHYMHWSTDNDARHRALGKYYERIIKLADDLAEAYMGRYEQLKKFNVEFHNATDPVVYMVGIRDFVADAREHLPQDTELQNIIDEIAKLINTTVFKLKYLE